MTVFPVFYGEDKEDPEVYLREFRRVCVANNDRDEASWVQLLPDFLEKAARRWYLRQPIVIKTNWDQLRQKFIAEFQPRESYQSLMHALSTASQQPYENLRVFCEQVRELQTSIERSIAQMSGPNSDGSLKDHTAEYAGVASLVLRSFTFGLLPAIHEAVSFANLPTLDEAFDLRSVRRLVY